MTLLFWLTVTFIATALVWYGSGLLESSSERLAVHYRLPEIVQGAIVVAVGSSFPRTIANRLKAKHHLGTNE